MKMNTKETAERVIAAVIAYFENYNGLAPAQSYGDLKKALKNCLCEAVAPVLKKKLREAVDSLLDHVENVLDVKPDATSFINMLIQVLTPYFPTEFLHFLESTFEDTMKTLKRSPRKILKKTVGKTANRVTSKLHDQEASLSISSSDLHQFEEFLTDLLKCFFSDLVDEIKNELSVMFCNLKTQAAQDADKYVTEHLIPELSRLIQSSCGVSVDKQLMSLKPFVIKGLATFLKEGRVLNKDEIIQKAKRGFPELVIETAIPNVSENIKTLVRNALNQVIAFFDNYNGLTPAQSYGDLEKALKNCLCEVVAPVLKKQLMGTVDSLLDHVEKVLIKPNATSFIRMLVQVLTTYFPTEFLHFLESTFEDTMKASESIKTLVRNALNQVQEAIFSSGTTLSVDKFLKVLFEKCSNEVFCIHKDKLSQVIDKLIETMPDYIDDITEFMTRHVLPVLSVCFEATAFALIAVFLTESSKRLRKEGRVRGRDLAMPLARKALYLASKNVAKNTAEEVSKVSSKVMTEMVTKNKVTHKTVQKCVLDKVGGKMAKETSKKVAVKSTKNIVAKVTQDATSKTITTAGKVTAKQSVKVGTKAVKSVSDKAIKSISGKTTDQGVRVAGRKTVQKVSVKVTKNLGDGISNGVTEVTKKVAVKKTTKATVTETAETITATTTTKVTKETVSKTSHIAQTSSKAATEVGIMNAAKAGLTAAGISAVVGGVFLYRDLKDLDREKEEGILSEKEYKEQKAQRVGEYAGDVIGSGVVGAAVSIAALSGPAGWAAIGVGALFSFATEKLGGQIAKALA